LAPAWVGCGVTPRNRSPNIVCFAVGRVPFLEHDFLRGFVHFLTLLVAHNFRCPRHRNALAGHANLLAKRAIWLVLSQQLYPVERGWLARRGFSTADTDR